MLPWAVAIGLQSLHTLNDTVQLYSPLYKVMDMVTCPLKQKQQKQLFGGTEIVLISSDVKGIQLWQETLSCNCSNNKPFSLYLWAYS